MKITRRVEPVYKDRGVIVLILIGIVLPLLLLVVCGYMDYKDNENVNNNEMVGQGLNIKLRDR